ncbi:hypothetical protein [Shimia sp. FJ5]|uniref:hypothetical protein n=1 Tax=Shimia sp. FJ5 TaxID=3079054 RepID=UPI002627C981|nr:hypothetical protein [Shimia sp. FJ5]MDV4145521.1 hypothetical protein [Shimia sp. FJ5]
MSDTDSFIEEVTEEVRRDKLFALLRKYGWIGVLAVLLIVGGAGFKEWQKAQARAEAEATGDMLFAAVEKNDDAARAEALSALEVPSQEAEVVVDLLTAAHQLASGDKAAASATLDGLAGGDAETLEIYRQIALFKSVVIQGAAMPSDERRVRLESLATPGAPLALLAEEQLALVDIEDGNTEAAIERLQGVIADAAVTAGLRRRASQLIVALGGTPQAANQ